jgi:hypothetical protein
MELRDTILYMERTTFLEAIDAAFKTHSIVAILGPRQCGKTTLSRQYGERLPPALPLHTFDMEDPSDIAALENPKAALSPLEGVVVIDEIQRLPDLFPLLRVLVDAPECRKKFLILGSASRDLIQQSSETLAGRIAYIELPPFTLDEVDDTDRLWIQGGFPRSYLAEAIEESLFWREQYVSTFLERDIPNLGIRIPPQTLRRFWKLLAHYHGSLFNASEIGKVLGVAGTTVKHYLDILTGTFMVRSLTPWLTNTKKRQVKTPKMYFRDSGIFHTLSDVTDFRSLLHHPKLGASWEGFALEHVIRHYRATADEAFFWGVHGGGELDLLILKGGKRLGFECKYTDAPRATPSMYLAIEELELDSLTILYPGDKNYAVDATISVRSLASRAW